LYGADDTSTNVQRDSRSPPMLPPNPSIPDGEYESSFRSKTQSRILFNWRGNQLTASVFITPTPHRRVATATFSMEFPDGRIAAMQPRIFNGSETEVSYTEENSRELSGSLGSPSTLPVQLSAGATTETKVTAEYSKRTRSRIIGSGVYGRKAHWVLEEDDGPAGRQGLEPELEFSVEMSIRPAHVEFSLELEVVRGGSSKSWWRRGKEGTKKQKCVFERDRDLPNSLQPAGEWHSKLGSNAMIYLTSLFPSTGVAFRNYRAGAYSTKAIFPSAPAGITIRDVSIVACHNNPSFPQPRQ
jgi:hypothetical protein